MSIHHMPKAKWGVYARVLHLIVYGTGALCLRAQCVSYVLYPYPGVCQGTISLSCDAGSVDSIIWSTGEVGLEITGLDTGSYSYHAYYQGTLVNTATYELTANEWHFMDTGSGWPTFNDQNEPQYAWVVQASIGYCGTSAWNYPCCDPHGVFQWIIDSVQYPPGTEEVPCFGAGGLMHLDFGHVYCIRLVDDGCGTTLDGPCIITHSCANLQLDTIVVGSTPGEANGSIDVLQLIPDTTEPYPISAPVIGTFDLISLNDYAFVEPTTLTDGSAQWTGLDTGYYVIWFTPAAGCQILRDTIYVPALAGLGEHELQNASVMSLASNVVSDMLRILSHDPQGSIYVRVIDMSGHTLIERKLDAGMFFLGDLPPGFYALHARQGGNMLRTRFLKR